MGVYNDCKNLLINEPVLRRVASKDISKNMDSSIQDSLLFDIETGAGLLLDLSESKHAEKPQDIVQTDIEVVLPTEKDLSRKASATLCTLKGNKLSCYQTGKSGFILLRSDPFGLLFAVEDLPINAAEAENAPRVYEITANEGDLLLLWSSGLLEKLGQDGIIKTVSGGVKNRGKRASPSDLAEELVNQATLSQGKMCCQAEESLTVVAAWISQSI